MTKHETTPHGKKSSHSGNQGGNCVEVAPLEGVGVRDTKHRNRGHLAIPASSWGTLTATIKH